MVSIMRLSQSIAAEIAGFNNQAVKRIYAITIDTRNSMINHNGNSLVDISVGKLKLCI